MTDRGGLGEMKGRNREEDWASLPETNLKVALAHCTVTVAPMGQDFVDEE